jgi:hypothetical protein
MSQLIDVSPAAPLTAGARKRDPFYVAFAAVLLALVVGGFTPTFFLNPFLANATYPTHVFLHGVAGTSWFVLFLVQTVLAARERLALHRALGVAAALVAGVAFASTVFAAVLVFPRLAAAGVDGEAVMGMSRAAQTARDTLAVVPFGVFLALGVALRRWPEAHKRLMLLAAIGFTTAALPRLLRWVGLTPEAAPLAALGVFVALIASMFAHDLVTRGRVHAATAVGGPSLLAYSLAVAFAVPVLLA